jgi:hypothetical protein
MSKTAKFPEVGWLSEGLAAVSARLDPERAAVTWAEAAAVFIQPMSASNPAELEHLSRGLAAVVTREPTALRQQRFRSLAGSLVLATSPAALPLSLTGLASALKPLPEQMPAQMLVDLLKHPLCVGDARRIVLGALGTRCHRTFDDQWEFVRFATEQHLDLDLTSPPKRAEPAAAAQKPAVSSRQ